MERSCGKVRKEREEAVGKGANDRRDYWIRKEEIIKRRCKRFPKKIVRQKEENGS